MREIPETLNDIHVLVVDDQADVCRGLKRLIGTTGCQVGTASSGEEALAELRDSPFDIVITDIKMDGLSGIDLLHEINREWPEIEVVLITGYGTIDMAVSCLQNGASHFITKPFDNEDILTFVRRAGYRILARKQRLAGERQYRSPRIIAESPVMHAVLQQVEQVAPSGIPVVVQGKSGTGKELVARTIHNKSQVRDKPFLAINCAALPDSLLESELFGYKKGAFTGAHQDSPGLFQQADGGTIFLDEIASMSLSFQGKLLRVLEEKVVRPLGSTEDINVKFRLIVATNQSLQRLVEQDDFRQDLFYRLDVFKIQLPPLSERKACIPSLAEYFVERNAPDVLGEDIPIPEISPAAMRALEAHHWPGNIRELENTIKRALVVCRGDTILPAHLGFEKANG
ncbi:MAG TPA: sigma-54 dependent transcriptional regulator, partial [bacterium]|nr:sigma-54 dependent transcriptional regulator [bacterium]